MTDWRADRERRPAARSRSEATTRPVRRSIPALALAGWAAACGTPGDDGAGDDYLSPEPARRRRAAQGRRRGEPDRRGDHRRARAHPRRVGRRLRPRRRRGRAGGPARAAAGDPAPDRAGGPRPGRGHRPARPPVHPARRARRPRRADGRVARPVRGAQPPDHPPDVDGGDARGGGRRRLLGGPALQHELRPLPDRRPRRRGLRDHRHQRRRRAVRAGRVHGARPPRRLPRARAGPRLPPRRGPARPRRDRHHHLRRHRAAGDRGC